MCEQGSERREGGREREDRSYAASSNCDCCPHLFLASVRPDDQIQQFCPNERQARSL